MAAITNAELIERAKSVINPRKVGECEVGGVGGALVTDKGNVYVGVCIDVCSGIGFCAEHSAIAAMLTNGEHRITKIVAIWEDHVVPPCGRCREFIHQLDKANLDATEVILGESKVVTLRELLPHNDWPG